MIKCGKYYNYRDIYMKEVGQAWTCPVPQIVQNEFSFFLDRSYTLSAIKRDIVYFDNYHINMFIEVTRKANWSHNNYSSSDGVLSTLSAN